MSPCKRECGSFMTLQQKGKTPKGMRFRSHLPGGTANSCATVICIADGELSLLCSTHVCKSQTLHTRFGLFYVVRLIRPTDKKPRPYIILVGRKAMDSYEKI